MSVVEIHSKKEYKKYLSREGLIIVDYSAEWCGPCQKIGPIYQSLAAKYPDATFLHIDIDEVPSEEISSVPTFMFYRDGEKIEEFSGASTHKLTGTINRLYQA
jgi:thiol-disulfide isomerase/thioredoxin